MARRVVLLRHGQTAWNAARRFQGQSDIPLDPTGLRQAEAAAALLAGQRPDAVLTSDLARALDTATPLARRLGLSVTVDPRLRETDLGRWEGLTHTEVKGSFPQEWDDWVAGRLERRGGGESREEVGVRMRAALADAVGDTVVLVTHGAAARTLAVSLLALTAEFWRTLAPLENGHWADLSRHARGWRLDRYNVGPWPTPDPPRPPPTD